jgi:hypothetical protein
VCRGVRSRTAEMSNKSNFTQNPNTFEIPSPQNGTEQYKNNHAQKPWGKQRVK